MHHVKAVLRRTVVIMLRGFRSLSLLHLGRGLISLWKRRGEYSADVRNFTSAIGQCPVTCFLSAINTTLDYSSNLDF